MSKLEEVKAKYCDMVKKLENKIEQEGEERLKNTMITRRNAYKDIIRDIDDIIKGGEQMVISDLPYEEAEIIAQLDNTVSLLREYNKKVNEYTYIRNLIVKDREKKRRRLEEIKSLKTDV